MADSEPEADVCATYQAGCSSGSEPAGTVVSLPCQTESAKTIYQRLGGRPAVLAAVELLYQKVLADIRLQQIFVGADLDKLMKHQVAFLTLVFGGCQQYLGLRLAAAHEHLICERGLTVEHFDMVLEHLSDALEELDAALHELSEPSDLVGVAADVMAALESLRPAFAPPADMLAEAQAAHACSPV